MSDGGVRGRARDDLKHGIVSRCLLRLRSCSRLRRFPRVCLALRIAQQNSAEQRHRDETTKADVSPRKRLANWLG